MHQDHLFREIFPEVQERANEEAQAQGEEPTLIDDRIWLSPNSPACDLFFFNDNLLFYNFTSRDFYVMRLLDSNGMLTKKVIDEARDNCSLVGPQNEDLRYLDDNGNMLGLTLAPANAFVMFNVNRDKLDLTTLSQAKIIFVYKDEYDAKVAAQPQQTLKFDTCGQMSFTVAGDQARLPENYANKETWGKCIRSSYEYLNNQPEE